MGKISAVQKSNRHHNSGGVAPDPIALANTLCIAIERCKTHGSEQVDLDKLICAFLLLWLNNKLIMIKSVNDIPDIKRVSGGQDCTENSIRFIREGNISWVEYAQLYHTQQESSWHWQPVPDLINHFFLSIFEKSYGKLLNKDEKNALLKIIIEPWKTPKAFKHKPRMPKNSFFCYLSMMIKQAPSLSVTAKSVLLTTDLLHHRSACAYQQERSDHIRRTIFDFHNQQLSLIQYTLSKLKITVNFLRREDKRPNYLNDPNRIAELTREQTKNTHQYRETPFTLIGSSRALSKNDVRQFFSQLHQEQKELKQTASNLSKHRAYYNFYTYVLAFEFLLLTGCRPTHAISLEGQHCYALQRSIVEDKGRFRPLYLCSYLKKRIEAYQMLQTTLLVQLGLSNTSPYLWFLLDSSNHVVHLSAKSMRQFMQEHWPESNSTSKSKAVPYCLRHTFAQTAASSKYPKLTNPQIDRLMGHSNFGEHLGCDQRFPASRKLIEDYLEQLPEYFFLSPEL